VPGQERTGTRIAQIQAAVPGSRIADLLRSAENDELSTFKGSVMSENAGPEAISSVAAQGRAGGASRV